MDYPGSTAYSAAFWRDRVKSLEQTTDVVTLIADTQVAHHLLRSCLDGCKVNHLLRATHSHGHPSVARADAVISSAFEDILGSTLSKEQLTQASLPLAAGGCGLRLPSRVRPAARIAALANFYARGAQMVGLPTELHTVDAEWAQAPLQDLTAALGQNLDPLARWAADPGTMCHASGDSLRQKWWSEMLGKAALNRLLDSVPPRDQARLLEQSKGIGSGFMAAIPSAQLHTSFNAAQYRLALKWWLGDAPCPGCQHPLPRLRRPGGPTW